MFTLKIFFVCQVSHFHILGFLSPPSVLHVEDFIMCPSSSAVLSPLPYMVLCSCRFCPGMVADLGQLLAQGKERVEEILRLGAEGRVWKRGSWNKL